MGAVFHKEIRSSFTNMTAPVAVGVVLLLSGIMFWYFNMVNGVLTLSYAYGNTGLVFYIVMPVLSMRIFAEERRDRTDQLLYTSGLTLREIIFGKFFALAAVFAIPVIVMGFLPLIMKGFGDENLLWDYTCLLAFYLEGCAYLSVGMFISACTESVVIAAILSILFVFVTQLGSSILEAAGVASSLPGTVVFLLALAAVCSWAVYAVTASPLAGGGLFLVLCLLCTVVLYAAPDWFDGRVRTFFSAVDFASRIDDFTRGSLKLANVVYFLSVAAAGLLLTHLAEEKRRWS